jgi:O-antigen/teichoic acid export membrane protein
MDNDINKLDDRQKLTGTDRMVSNVFSSWGMQFAFIVAGFIIPRMIDKELGQIQLGIWDFCWSIVAYFKLVKAGIVSSVNPFVAKYRTIGDFNNVNISINSVTAVLIVMGVIVIFLSIATSYLLPKLFAQQLADNIKDGRVIILLLGISLSFEIFQSGLGGLLTGCHRWDILNGINASVRLFTLAAMILCLIFDAKLIYLAAIEMTGEVFGLFLKAIAAKIVFKPLRLSVSLVSIRRVKKMMRFGGKTFVPALGQLLMNQTIRLLIVWHLGPALLAVFARPASLVTHITTFVTRYAFVLTPTASSIKSLNDKEGIKKLAIQATRYGAFLTLPMVITIAIFGGPILRAWMGEKYDNQMLITIMSLGALPFLLQLPANSVLRGLNAHGKPGIARLLAALSGALLCGLCLAYISKNILAVALSAVLPLALEEALFISYFYAKKIEIPFLKYLKESMIAPLLCTLPLLVIMLSIRLIFQNSGYLPLAAALLFSGVVTGIIYYYFALPQRYKEKFEKKYGKILFFRKKVIT